MSRRAVPGVLRERNDHRWHLSRSVFGCTTVRSIFKAAAFDFSTTNQSKLFITHRRNVSPCSLCARLVCVRHVLMKERGSSSERGPSAALGPRSLGGGSPQTRGSAGPRLLDPAATGLSPNRALIRANAWKFNQGFNRFWEAPLLFPPLD